MDTLEWTTETPARRGLYWGGIFTVHGFRMTAFNIYKGSHGEMRYTNFGSSESRPLKKSGYTHWLGPLPEPELSQT